MLQKNLSHATFRTTTMPLLAFHRRKGRNGAIGGGFYRPLATSPIPSAPDIHAVQTLLTFLTNDVTKSHISSNTKLIYLILCNRDVPLRPDGRETWPRWPPNAKKTHTKHNKKKKIKKHNKTVPTTKTITASIKKTGILCCAFDCNWLLVSVCASPPQLP